MVTRIQGGLDVFQKIQLASKAMLGIPPEMLLVAVLQGVGEAFEIRELAGISAARHLCYCDADSAIFKRAYDEFFTRIGATKNPADFFVASIPLPEKPLSAVKRGQKTRSRARRALRMRMAIDAFEALCADESATTCAFSYDDDADVAESAEPEPGTEMMLHA